MIAKFARQDCPLVMLYSLENFSPPAENFLLGEPEFAYLEKKLGLVEKTCYMVLAQPFVL